MMLLAVPPPTLFTPSPLPYPQPPFGEQPLLPPQPTAAAAIAAETAAAAAIAAETTAAATAAAAAKGEQFIRIQIVVPVANSGGFCSFQERWRRDGEEAVL